jgi:hypothetical protein
MGFLKQLEDIEFYEIPDDPSLIDDGIIFQSYQDLRELRKIQWYKKYNHLKKSFDYKDLYVLFFVGLAIGFIFGSML